MGTLRDTSSKLCLQSLKTGASILMKSFSQGIAEKENFYIVREETRMEEEIIK